MAVGTVLRERVPTEQGQYFRACCNQLYTQARGQVPHSVYLPQAWDNFARYQQEIDHQIPSEQNFRRFSQYQHFSLPDALHLPAPDHSSASQNHPH